MRGMKIVIRGGVTRDRHPLFFDETKYRAGKHARVDRATKSWLIYAHLIFWVSLCAFIVTLGPDLFWLVTSERPVESSLAGANSSNRNRLDHQANIQARPLLSTSPLEFKHERLQTAKLRSTGIDIRRAPAKSRHKTIADNGRRIPRGPSGLLAEFKIFVYDLPPKFNRDWLIDERCGSHLFAAEVAIHQILLTSPLRTRRPEEADFFFMPVYVSCNFSTKTGFPSVAHAPSLLRSAVDLVSREMPYWNQSRGSDHVFVATHDHGACFHTIEDIAVAAGIPNFLRRSIILQTFGRTDAHPCQDVEHIQIPPYVSPSVQQVWASPEKQHRDIWVFFRGKMEIHPKNIDGRVYSRGIRTVIWKKFGRDSRFYLKRKRSADYQSEIRRSTFCLCPLGWAPWSPRIVEAVAFGCVPVIIADNISLPYSHIVNWPQISLSVPEKDVGKLDKILDKVSRTNLTTLQKNLWKEQNRRALLYTQPQVEGDASWQIFELLATKLNRSARHSFHMSLNIGTVYT